ncbi:MAG: hypothetical protein ACYCS4_11115 [Acidimicrobiales bacterium]
MSYCYDRREAEARQRAITDQRVRDAHAALGGDPTYAAIQAWLRERDGYGVHPRAIARVANGEDGWTPAWPIVRRWRADAPVQNALAELGLDATYAAIQAWLRAHEGHGTSNRTIARVRQWERARTLEQ